MLRKGQKIYRRPKPLAERFATKYVVDDETGCWLWTAYVDPGGYGTIGALGSRKPLLAHRVSYELHVGPIPEGLTIDHLCHTRDPECLGVCQHRRCVNPAHLEAVTFEENMRRGGNAAKTRCIRGHEFTPENTYFNPDGTGRRCKECGRANTRRVRARRRAMAA